MEKYFLMNTGYIQRESDLALIPINKENKDYLKYLEDVGAGSQVLPFDYEAEKIRQEEGLKNFPPPKEYQEKRRGEYPNFLDFLDAKVKQASEDSCVREEGIKQEQDYINKCLEVKSRFPKV